MKESIVDGEFNTRLIASDWRYAAAALGIEKYLNRHKLKYKIEDDSILYNQEDITEERYLMFVEYSYKDRLHHSIVEKMLGQKEYSDKECKEINKKLTANATMKSIFKNIVFNGDNREQILNVIEQNRLELIKGNFCAYKGIYDQFANTNQFFNDTQPYCRLNGYYIDAGKKGRSTAYKFNQNTFVSNDILEFDFIPFAFSGDMEVFFINDNLTINSLVKTNKAYKKFLKDAKQKNNDSLINKYDTARVTLFKNLITSADFIQNDIEVIVKKAEQDYFETLYIRQDSIDIFKRIGEKKPFEIDYNAFNTAFKIGNDYYRNVFNEVIDCILNHIYLDDLIELSIKSKREYLASQLIKVDVLIRGGESMEKKLSSAFACARSVAEKLEANKLDSYRQKLTSSIVFKDYDRFCQILLQLSNYVGMEFKFAYDLFEDFETNKDVAYTFINALGKQSNNKED